MALVKYIIEENCRFCQNEPGKHDFTSNEKLISQIMELTKIKINDDLIHYLPKFICDTCKSTVEDFIKFIEYVRKVDKNLRQIYRRKASEMESKDNIVKSSVINFSTYKCNKCPAQFYDNNLFLKHTESHVSTKYKCLICSKTYSRQINFESHKKSHPELYCSYCKIAFQSVLDGKAHKCPKSKNLQNNEDLDIKYADDAIDATDKPEKFTCSRENCGKICTSAYAFKIHELRHQGKRPFLCVTCGKRFITKNSLNNHEKIHLEFKAYCCKLCNIGFSVKSNLRAHEKKHHEGIRFYCSQCTKAFITKCSLVRHEKIHAGIKEFKCDSCPAAFYTSKELVKHQRYHQGLRQYKCDECFKTFFERHHLTVHLRSHTGERPYVCSIPNCGKSFAESQKLKRHLNAKHTQLQSK